MNSTRYSQALSRHTPTTLALCPANFPGGRGEAFSQTNILLITTGIGSSLRIPRGTYMEWLHLPHQVSMGSSSSLCKKKKDGSLCLCVDFHALNKVMEKDHYPLLLI